MDQSILSSRAIRGMYFARLEANAGLCVTPSMVERAVERLGDVEELMENRRHPLPRRRLPEEQRPQGDRVQHAVAMKRHQRLATTEPIAPLAPGETQRLHGASRRAPSLARQHEDGVGIDVTELLRRRREVREQPSHALAEVRTARHGPTVPDDATFTRANPSPPRRRPLDERACSPDGPSAL